MSSRLRAIGYLASGWLPAIRRMLRFSDIKRSKPTSRKRAGTTGTGSAKPAKKGDLVAVIQNDLKALEDEKVRIKAESALGRAFRYVQRDMEEYLTKKMRKAARDSGIETR